MSPDFPAGVSEITRWLQGRALTPDLGQELSARFPPTGPEFRALADLCRAGVTEGWLATRGEDPLRWGRVIKPTAESDFFSVDVVRMTDVAGPHHAHPQGEIDMIIPLDPEAQFDGQGEGWLVYGPGSAHSPTVSGGAAVVLYLLPGGEIDFNAG